MRNPINLDPYLNIVNDSTYNTVKFFFDQTLRQEAHANFNKRKQAYLNSGITEDDLYNQEILLFREKYRELIEYYGQEFPLKVVDFLFKSDDIIKIIKLLF